MLKKQIGMQDDTSELRQLKELFVSNTYGFLPIHFLYLVLYVIRFTQKDQLAVN